MAAHYDDEQHFLFPINYHLHMLIRLLISAFILSYIHIVLAYKTIIDALSEDKDKRFETLLTHLQNLQLETLVNSLEAGTMFAPDNNAFEKCQFDIDREILLYHLIKKGMVSADFYQGQLKETLLTRPGYLGPDNKAGQRIKFTLKDGNKKKAYVNQAKIIDRDIQVNNQTYIQVIDCVLQPPQLLGMLILKRVDLS
jgi:uncharacterized surface protein with fasciclin (FAS1) repeats